MATLVRRFDDVLQAIRELPPSGRLFSFFAFDERPSHRGVLDFLNDAADWIDHLSARSGVLSIIVARNWSWSRAVRKPSKAENPFAWLPMERAMTAPERQAEREQYAFLKTLDHEDLFLNPSITLASCLGVEVSSLPGLIFFTAVPPYHVEQALFVPLDVETFKDGLRSAEGIIIDLFSAARSVLDSGHGSSTLDELRRSLLERGFSPDLRTPTDKDLIQILESAEDKARTHHLGDRISQVLPPHEVRTDTKVFISYAREDTKYAELIYLRLEEAGFSPWMDKHSLLPGEIWEQATGRAIQAADFFLACLSRQSVAKREYVQREFRRALDLWTQKLESDIYLIPVRLDECDVPDSLSRFQWVDFQQGVGWPRIMEAITEGLRRRGRLP